MMNQTASEEVRRGWLMGALAGVTLLFAFWLGSFFYMQYARIAEVRSVDEAFTREFVYEYVRYDNEKWFDRGVYAAHYPLRMIRNRFFPSFGYESRLE